MATVEITSDNLEQTITENEIVLIDFWAEWCGPCKRFEPIYDRAAETHPDIVFGKVDTEAQQELARAFGVMSIPTLAIFRSEIPVFMQPGALPAPALEELIQRVRALDMDEVRAAVGEHEHGPDCDH